MADQPKAGVKTTEFWAMAIVAVIVAIAPRIGVEIEPETQATIVGGLVAAYGVGRSIVKALTPKQ